MSGEKIISNEVPRQNKKLYFVFSTRSGKFKVVIKECYGKKCSIYTLSKKYGFKTEEKARKYIKNKRDLTTT